MGNIEQVNSGNLIVGLGGTGGRVLKELRKRLYDEHDDIPAGIGFMYVDASNELMQNDDSSWLTAEGYNAQFAPSEYLNISLRYPDSSLVVPAYFPNLQGIIENCERLKTYQPSKGAMNDRRLGRVLLGIHAADFDRLLQKSVHDLQEQTLCSNLNVTIVSGLAGGTGLGCATSVIGHILQRYPEAHVTVMATLPVPSPPGDDELGYYLANAYAALKELNALNIGRLKLSDLVTGEKFQPEMPYDHTLNYCHYLQENKVFRLFLFESFYNEFSKIVNILYHNLIYEPNNTTFHRLINMYSVITEPECDASASKGKHVYARTKAVGLLGLYRLVYPRQQILRHVAYGVAEQSYNQLLFNHYTEYSGYVKEPLPTMPIGIKDLILWGMDEAHLTLDKAWDDRNHHFRRFRDEWEIVSSIIADVVRDNGGNSPISDMAERFHNHYKSHFRNWGVDIYFHKATASIREHADHCMGKYESHVVSSLMTGKKGVYNAIDETKGLIKHLQSLLKETENKETDCRENIHRCQDEITHDFEFSFLKRIILRDQYIQRIKDALAHLYEEKTRDRALVYESQLISELVVRAQELVATLEELKHFLTYKRDEANQLGQEKGAPSNTLYIVNRERVELFKVKLVCCRPVMEELAALTRNHIFGKEQQSIRQLVNDMRYGLMTQRLKNLYYETILLFDSRQNALEQLLSAGILEEIIRLSIDKNRLTDMLRTGIDAASVRTLLNDNEILRATPNNPLPTDNGGLGLTTTLFRIPQPMDEHEEELSKLLMTSAKALDNHYWIEINSHSGNPNEISMTTVFVNFPLRRLKSLPKFKEQYDFLMAKRGQQAMWMLHTEDSFTNLPSLEVEEYFEQPVNN